MTAARARNLWKAGIKDPHVLLMAGEGAVVRALAAGLAGQMRSRPAPGGNQQAQHGQQQQQRGQAAAAGVAARAAKALMAAARAHVVATAQAAEYLAASLLDETEASLAAATEPSLKAHGQACRVATAQQKANATAGGQAKVTQLTPTTPEGHLMQFLEAWAAQPLWAVALFVAGPPPTSTAHQGSHKPRAQEAPPLAGLAVTWRSEEAFFLDASQQHMQRRLQGRGGVTLHAAVAAIAAAPSVRKLLFDCLQALPVLAGVGLEIMGQIEDPLVAAQLLTPDAEQLDLKALHRQLAPAMQVRLPQVVQAGVSATCRTALLTLGVAGPACSLLGSPLVLDCYLHLQMPAAVAMARTNAAAAALAGAPQVLSSAALKARLQAVEAAAALPLGILAQQFGQHTAFRVQQGDTGGRDCPFLQILSECRLDVSAGGR